MPRSVTASSVRSSSATNSPKRSARSFGVHASCPRAVASKPLPPAPMPRVIRPPETSSSVISSLASVTGCRKFGEVTRVPSPSRSVAVAAAVSVGSAPNHGPSRKLRQDRWS
ncbi:hypothetical protein STANM309S_03433 [Streptomyces tanashiensis]